MAYRASPPRIVPPFAKAAVDTVEAVPSTATDFTNLERSTVRHADGFASGEFAILPDKHDYDKLKFVFGPITAGGTLTTAAISIWVRGSDGSVHLFGTSTMTDGLLPAIEGENYQGTYAATVSTISGAGGEITVNVFVQGVHVSHIS